SVIIRPQHAETSILCPYTTLFRSRAELRRDHRQAGGRRSQQHHPLLRRQLDPEPIPERRRRFLGKGVAAKRVWPHAAGVGRRSRSEEQTSELQSRENLVCRLLLEK